MEHQQKALQVVCRVVMALLVMTLPSVCRLKVYCSSPLHSIPHTHVHPHRSEEAITKRWIFPYKFERTAKLSKRKLEPEIKPPCINGLCENVSLEAVSRIPSWHRPLMWDLTDLRLYFLKVLAVIAVKIIMSTALASWFVVAGQLLLVIADITGTTRIFGNGSPLTYVFQALPLVEMILKHGSAVLSS